MLVVLYATIVLLTGAIFGDTIIKDNPAQFKAVATNGNGKKIPVSGEMDTIQVFDIHPAGENFTDPGLSIDINVTPLNETEGEMMHSPAATKYPNPNLSQVTSTFTLPSDYSKINYALPPTAGFDDEAVLPFPAQDKVGQNPANPVMMPPAPDLATPAGITPVPGQWNKSTPPSSYANTAPNKNLFTTPPTGKPPTDINSFSNPFLTGTNAFAPNVGQNLNPFSANSSNFGANQNPFGAFSLGGFPTFGNASAFPTDQNESPFKLSNTTSQPAENPFNIFSTHTFPPMINPFAPTFGQNTNPPAENPFNISSSHPFQPTLNPFAPPFGQNSNPFNIFNPANTPFTPNFFNFPTANPSQPAYNPFAPPADKNSNPFGTFPANPFFAENPFKPTAKPPSGNPFNPFTPTLTQNILPLGGSLFNKENPFPTGGFPTATSPNPFLPNFGGAGKPLFGGKPNRVTGPNPDDSNVVVVPRSADDYNETASYSDHKSGSLLGKLFNLFGSSKNSSDPKVVDYDSQTSPATNNSAPIDYSDMMAAAPNNPGNTDFINPLIYKAYFNPTMWNKFTNITDFDDSDSLGNANNPFAAFNPSASPLAFMKNVNPWSPGNVNNPWNPNNFNQALLNLTSLMSSPTSSFGAGFNFPSFRADSQSPWNINASTPGLVEIFGNGSSPELSVSSLENVNTSLLPPQAFAASDVTNTTHRPLPMLQMPKLNLLADLPGAMNITDLMKNVGDSINLLTGNSSQALLLKSLSDGGGNSVNWPPAVFPPNPPKFAPAPLPSPAASFGSADAPDTRMLSDVHKSVEELPISQPKRVPAIEIDTIPAVNALVDGKDEFYGDDPKVSEVNETTAGGVLVNGTVLTEAPQNGALVVLSSWMMIIGIVVGAIAQKLCN